MTENLKLKQLFSTYQIVAMGFAAIIFMGTFLLMLPVASNSGDSLSFVDALFTSTSAVCVTGLIVVDTGTYFSLFGQLVIILLIQCGGIGLMTLATLATVALGRKISLHERMVMRDALNQGDIAGVVRITLGLVKITLLIEFIAGSILAVRFFQDYGAKGIYYGYWHAVSAFCNAGFDVFGHYKSITGYVDDWTVNIVITSLIILGGLGFTVMMDVWRVRNFQKLTLHSKIVIITTFALIAAGTLGVFFFEKNNAATLAPLSWQGKILASYFQSVTARTAGFNSIDMNNLSNAMMFLLTILMFIGASPTSTGGGIKTTTFAVAVMYTWAIIRGKTDVVIFERHISEKTAGKAFAVIVISGGIVVLGCLFLCVTEEQSFIHLLFETTSAFATVGLSCGITGQLSDAGKIVLSFIMFAGRVGPLTLALALALKGGRGLVKYPEENINIG